MFSPNHKSTRKGFTLLEISLVLLILVVVSAIASPMFVGTLEHERLRKATESIGADWTRTRAIAMQTGETQLWACKLGTGQYSVSAANPDLSAVGASSGASATDLLSQDMSEALPTDIVISKALISESDTIMTMSVSSETSESGVATMFFYPDGTCSAARLTLNKQDNQNRSMSVMINGLAGTVRILQGSASSGAAQ